ncbi:MAG: AMP-binding protein, partial [Alphaproteobacteria bacterium]
MLPKADSYEALCRAFRWDVPARCNIAVDCCDRHAEGGAGDRVALVEPGGRDGVRRWTFADLRGGSNRVANVLRAQGVVRGDRIGILLGQRAETVLA